MSPASDVWSLGMTLVEALTQSPPVWKEAEQAEPVLPETLPEPFFDIASHCLRRNPHRRWTVAEIAARLQQPSSAFRKQRLSSPKARLRNGVTWFQLSQRCCCWRFLAQSCSIIVPGAEPEPSIRDRILAGQPAAKQSAAVQSEQTRQGECDIRPIERFARRCQDWCD